LPTLETPPYGALGAFLFRKIGGNGAFRSIASTRSFPVVGQVVGQDAKASTHRNGEPPAGSPQFCATV